MWSQNLHLKFSATGFQTLLSLARSHTKPKGCPGVARRSKTKLFVLVHIWMTFPMVENMAWLQSQILWILCHCIQTSFASFSSPWEPTRTLVFFIHPLLSPPLVNNQPLSFFSSHHARLSQIAHGKSPICKSIYPPSFSTFHITAPTPLTCFVFGICGLLFACLKRF